MKKIVFSIILCLALLVVPVAFLSACSTTKEIEEQTSPIVPINPDEDDGGEIDNDPVYYTISFNSNGGTQVESVEVLNGRSIQEPEAPTRAGYVFDGWYINSRYTAMYNFNEKVRGGGFTLFANWVDENLVLDRPEKTDEYYIKSCNTNAQSVDIPRVYKVQPEKALSIIPMTS